MVTFGIRIMANLQDRKYDKPRVDHWGQSGHFSLAVTRTTSHNVYYDKSMQYTARCDSDTCLDLYPVSPGSCRAAEPLAHNYIGRLHFRATPQRIKIDTFPAGGIPRANAAQIDGRIGYHIVATGKRGPYRMS
jgi:hypothetical protein